ncbi:rab geranylgeranyltransferase [Ceraceosorus bombacis]|uniref:Geranylgeranyl transferase type-2 subunit beta n=1 Tax=Ceraceosorus bombacis TaxID=401625 RepID=A0A0N7L8S0_9BASI|nr:rab geranylgeranyltransferase [Ceraceosorus bombacis]
MSTTSESFAGAVAGPSKPPPYLQRSLHIHYIASLHTHTSSLAYRLTTHLRLNAIYWALCTLHILDAPDALPRNELVQFTLSCWDEERGAFGPHPGHDGHVLASLSAVQILALCDALPDLDAEKRDQLIKFITSLQNPSTGAFSGDQTYLEEDTRFLYCSVSTLSLLGALHHLDKPLTIRAVLAVRNHDGGFGTVPGAESHAGQAFVCMGALAILGGLDGLDKKAKDKTATWLAERQLENGGLNGRPQKLEDVCYSWWVLTALSILHKLHWISPPKLCEFILSAQDPDHGGIADRPDNVADVFHTFFGVAGLSLLGYRLDNNAKDQSHESADVLKEEESGQGLLLQEIDPVYALPARVTKKLGLQLDYQALGR